MELVNIAHMDVNSEHKDFIFFSSFTRSHIIDLSVLYFSEDPNDYLPWRKKKKDC